MEVRTPDTRKVVVPRNIRSGAPPWLLICIWLSLTLLGVVALGLLVAGMVALMASVYGVCEAVFPETESEKWPAFVAGGVAMLLAIPTVQLVQKTGLYKEWLRHAPRRRYKRKQRLRRFNEWLNARWGWLALALILLIAGAVVAGKLLGT